MSEMTYHVEFAENTGSRAAAALSASAGGSFRNSSETVAFIIVPSDQVEYFEQLCEDDDNVIRYSVK